MNSMIINDDDIYLVGGNSDISYFHPYLGKWSNFTNIFQMGWFNHQLDDLESHCQTCILNLTRKLSYPLILGERWRVARDHVFSY